MNYGQNSVFVVQISTSGVTLYHNCYTKYLILLCRWIQHFTEYLHIFYLLHYGQGLFTYKLKSMLNHKLYWIDNVFLYPSIRDQIHLKFQQNQIKWHDYVRLNFIKFSYYHGQFLSHPKGICHGFKCLRQNLKLQVHRTNGYHLEVIYPKTVIYPVHLRTEAVVYPSELNWEKTIFYSYHIEFQLFLLCMDFTFLVEFHYLSHQLFKTCQWNI